MTRISPLELGGLQVGGSLALKTDPPAGHPAPPTRSAEMKKVAKQRHILGQG